MRLTYLIKLFSKSNQHIKPCVVYTQYNLSAASSNREYFLGLTTTASAIRLGAPRLSRNAPIISHYFFRKLIYSRARGIESCQLALSLPASLFKVQPLLGTAYIYLHAPYWHTLALPDVAQGAAEVFCRSCSSNKVHFVVQHDTSESNKSINHCSRNEEQATAVHFTCYSAFLPFSHCKFLLIWTSEAAPNDFFLFYFFEIL